MKVGIFDTPPRKWFGFDNDTEVELEFISKERMAVIVKKADDAKKKMGSMATPALFDMFLGKAAVHGWRHKDQDKNPGHPGLLLPNGAALAFDEKNRNLLMRGCAEFSTFVFHTCTSSAKFLEEESAADERVPLEELMDELVAKANLEEDEEGKNG